MCQMMSMSVSDYFYFDKIGKIVIFALGNNRTRFISYQDT